MPLPHPGRMATAFTNVTRSLKAAFLRGLFPAFLVIPIPLPVTSTMKTAS